MIAHPRRFFGAHTHAPPGGFLGLNMNAAELQALRRLLFFSVAEAARYLAADAQRPDGVEERTWNRWEAGKMPVPPNIAKVVVDMVEYRETVLQGLNARLIQQEANEAGFLHLPWCVDPGDWLHAMRQWRPHQSAQAAALAHWPRQLKLLELDAVVYHGWRRVLALRDGLENTQDNDAMRERWAADCGRAARRAEHTPPEVF